MQMLPLLFLSLLAADTSVTAPLWPVAGQVLDERGNGLEGTNVSVSSRNTGTTTNKNGFFRVRVTAVDTLLLTHMGFADRAVPLADVDSSDSVVVTLRRITLRMPNATVTASRKVRSRLSSHHAVDVVDKPTLTRHATGSTADVLQGAAGVAIQRTTPGHGTPGHIPEYLPDYLPDYLPEHLSV